MQQLSLATLVAHDPGSAAELGAGHPTYRFLGLTHGLAVIPSPRSFLRLRARRGETQDGNGFIGFGDPALSGSGARSGDARRAIDRGSGLARPDVLSALFEPLPETADELRELASNASESRLYLGAEAREATFKTLDLSGVRTLVFATHAIVAGDFDHLAEPALVMTPPERATPDDDGLLTTSEIATKSIGAELVILSACNTGSVSARAGAAGLSGLASGFFEAGARSLVVTHWTILSSSSLFVIPQFYAGLSEDRDASPSLALRAAMHGTANLRHPTHDRLLRHPAFWASFAVVGAR